MFLRLGNVDVLATGFHLSHAMMNIAWLFKTDNSFGFSAPPLL